MLPPRDFPCCIFNRGQFDFFQAVLPVLPSGAQGVDQLQKALPAHVASRLASGEGLRRAKIRTRRALPELRSSNGSFLAHFCGGGKDEQVIFRNNMSLEATYLIVADSYCLFCLRHLEFSWVVQGV